MELMSIIIESCYSIITFRNIFSRIKLIFRSGQSNIYAACCFHHFHSLITKYIEAIEEAVTLHIPKRKYIYIYINIYIYIQKTKISS